MRPFMNTLSHLTCYINFRQFTQNVYFFNRPDCDRVQQSLNRSISINLLEHLYFQQTLPVNAPNNSFYSIDFVNLFETYFFQQTLLVDTCNHF